MGLEAGVWFDDVPVGSTTSVELPVTNGGDMLLEITELRAWPEAFEVSDITGGYPPGQSTDLVVSFTAAQGGETTGFVEVVAPDTAERVFVIELVGRTE